MLKAIGHRGLWDSRTEPNTDEAFRRIRSANLGTETDVRDHCGRLVVSHDPPTGTAMTLEDLLTIFADSQLTLAINIKSDGLCRGIANAMRGVDSDWFAFDMSVPETVRYVGAGLPVFVRQSEYEPTPIMYGDAAGIWLDAFDIRWYDDALIRNHLGHGKRVCVVSSELHGREHLPQWEWLADSGLRDCDGLYLCTDYPLDACEYFGLAS